MITKFLQFDQNILFDLEKHSNSSSVLNIFYRLNSSNLEITKTY